MRTRRSRCRKGGMLKSFMGRVKEHFAWSSNDESEASEERQSESSGSDGSRLSGSDGSRLSGSDGSRLSESFVIVDKPISAKDERFNKLYQISEDGVENKQGLLKETAERNARAFVDFLLSKGMVSSEEVQESGNVLLVTTLNSVLDIPIIAPLIVQRTLAIEPGKPYLESKNTVLGIQEAVINTSMSMPQVIQHLDSIIQMPRSEDFLDFLHFSYSNPLIESFVNGKFQKDVFKTGEAMFDRMYVFKDKHLDEGVPPRGEYGTILIRYGKNVVELDKLFKAFEPSREYISMEEIIYTIAALGASSISHYDFGSTTVPKELKGEDLKLFGGFYHKKNIRSKRKSGKIMPKRENIVSVKSCVRIRKIGPWACTWKRA
jgi:hypothetical protein